MTFTHNQMSLFCPDRLVFDRAQLVRLLKLNVQQWERTDRRDDDVLNGICGLPPEHAAAQILRARADKFSLIKGSEMPACLHTSL